MDGCDNVAPTPAEKQASRNIEHFQEKWNPVFRPKMRQCKNASEALQLIWKGCKNS
jgi:hypothetical protein